MVKTGWENEGVPLSEAAGGKGKIDICLKEDFFVACVKRETGECKQIRFRVLFSNSSDFWLKNHAWEYFISLEDFARLNEDPPEEPSALAVPFGDILRDFGSVYEEIAAVPQAAAPEADRAREVALGAARLDSLFSIKPRQKEAVTAALVEAAQNTVLHNHAVLAEVSGMSNEDAKLKTSALVNSTSEFVVQSLRLISEDIFNDDLMNELAAKSNGSIIQHMTRVYLNALAFLSYYNKQVTTSSIVAKLRASFGARHRAFYNPLLRHLDEDEITLETVFLGGMRKVNESDVLNWAAGFLLHDIGKVAAVEYHEGEEAYNREIVMEHVSVGYTHIMNKTNYPKEAGFIAGCHHEYYGDPHGYGFFRDMLEEHNQKKPKAKQGACMAFDAESLLSLKTLAYFPAKVLEIVDVFDSLIDPTRKYRKALSAQEALANMREEFTVKHAKIDLILFEIFSKFVREKHRL